MENKIFEDLIALQSDYLGDKDNHQKLLSALQATKTFLDDFYFSDVKPEQDHFLKKIYENHQKVLATIPNLIEHDHTLLAKQCRTAVEETCGVFEKKIWDAIMFIGEDNDEYTKPLHQKEFTRIINISQDLLFHTIFQHDIIEIPLGQTIDQFISHNNLYNDVYDFLMQTINHINAYDRSKDLEFNNLENRPKNLIRKQYLSIQNAVIFLFRANQKIEFVTDKQKESLHENIKTLNISISTYGNGANIMNPFAGFDGVYPGIFVPDSIAMLKFKVLCNLFYLDIENKQKIYKHIDGLTQDSENQFLDDFKSAKQELLNSFYQSKVYLNEIKTYSRQNLNDFAAYCAKKIIFLNDKYIHDDFTDEKFAKLIDEFGDKISILQPNELYQILHVASYFDTKHNLEFLQSYSLEGGNVCHIKLEAQAGLFHLGKVSKVLGTKVGFILRHLNDEKIKKIIDYRPYEMQQLFAHYTFANIPTETINELKRYADNQVKSVFALPSLYDNTLLEFNNPVFEDGVDQTTRLLKQRNYLFIQKCAKIAYDFGLIDEKDLVISKSSEFLESLWQANCFQDAYNPKAYADYMDESSKKLFKEICSQLFASPYAVYQDMNVISATLSLEQKILLTFAIEAQSPENKTFIAHNMILSDQHYGQLLQSVNGLQRACNLMPVAVEIADNDNLREVSYQYADKVITELWFPFSRDVSFTAKHNKIEKVINNSIENHRLMKYWAQSFSLFPEAIDNDFAKNPATKNSFLEILLDLPLMQLEYPYSNKDLMSEIFYWFNTLNQKAGGKDLITKFVDQIPISSIELATPALTMSLREKENQLRRSYVGFIKLIQNQAANGRENFIDSDDFRFNWQFHQSHLNTLARQINYLIVMSDALNQLPDTITEREKLIAVYLNTYFDKGLMKEVVSKEEWSEFEKMKAGQFGEDQGVLYETPAYKDFTEKLAKAKSYQRLKSSQEQQIEFVKELRQNLINAHKTENGNQQAFQTRRTYNSRAMGRAQFGIVRNMQTMQKAVGMDGYAGRNFTSSIRPSSNQKPNFAARSASRPGMRVHSGVSMGNGVIMAELSNQFLQRFFPQFSSENPRLVGEINTGVFGLSALATKFFTDYKAVQKETGLKLGQILRHNAERSVSAWGTASHFMKRHAKKITGGAAVYGLYKLFGEKK